MLWKFDDELNFKKINEIAGAITIGLLIAVLALSIAFFQVSIATPNQSEHIRELPSFQALSVGLTVGGVIFAIIIGLLVKFTLTARLSLVEVSKINSELQRKKDSLQRTNHSLTRFAFIASHDLKEPLREIALSCQMLMRTATSKLENQEVRHLESVIQQAVKGADLLEHLRRFLSLTEPVRQSVDLTKLVQERINKIEDQIQSLNIQVKLETLPIVEVDKEQMVIVINNLLSNAVKYRRLSELSKISIQAVSKDDSWTISFHDNGIGIDKEYIEKAFAFFNQMSPHGHDNSTSSSGTSLAFCRKIIEGHNGSMWIDSVLGQFTTVFISLPKNQSAIEGTERRI
jgi:light-regulated signal transduction histidine kinase (bacteriophytochrome)